MRPTRRRPSNPAGEHPAGSATVRGEEFDIEERGFLSDVRVFVVMEQTVQIKDYHPVSARLGMEATIPDGASLDVVDGAFQKMEHTVSERLRQVMRMKIEQGLADLED